MPQAKRAKAAAKPRGRRQQSRPVIERPLDVSGREGTVEVLVDLLMGSSKQRKTYEAIRVANGHNLDDPVAGLPVTGPDGEVNSYRVVFERISQQEARLAEKYPTEMEEVRRRVAERDKRLAEQL